MSNRLVRYTHASIFACATASQTFVAIFDDFSVRRKFEMIDLCVTLIILSNYLIIMFDLDSISKSIIIVNNIVVQLRSLKIFQVHKKRRRRRRRRKMLLACIAN